MILGRKGDHAEREKQRRALRFKLLEAWEPLRQWDTVKSMEQDLGALDTWSNQALALHMQELHRQDRYPTMAAVLANGLSPMKLFRYMKQRGSVNHSTKAKKSAAEIINKHKTGTFPPSTSVEYFGQRAPDNAPRHEPFFHECDDPMDADELNAMSQPYFYAPVEHLLPDGVLGCAEHDEAILEFNIMAQNKQEDKDKLKRLRTQVAQRFARV
tara:strand:- start:46 stop:684 length:639 start_codon:yes stop_codon:yes gene_type:complete